MKRLVRAPAVQRFLAAMFAGYLRFCYGVIRWRVEGGEVAQSVMRDGDGAILCFWHARIPLSPPLWDQKLKTIHALISRSSDGEFITLTVAKLGFPAVRGSRANETSTGDKGGSAAFREMVRWVKAGNAMAITPDGPKGPATVMGDGTPLLARMTGAKVLLAGVACRPCIRFRSWDRTVLPLPFGRGAIVYEGPFTAARDQSPEILAQHWGERLNAATDRAEDLVA